MIDEVLANNVVPVTDEIRLVRIDMSKTSQKNDVNSVSKGRFVFDYFHEI